MTDDGIESRVRALERGQERFEAVSQARHDENVRRFDEAAKARVDLIASVERHIAEVRSTVGPIASWIEQQKGGQKMALLVLGGVSSIGGVIGGLLIRAITKTGG